jgi:inosine-uridine nucleoside N-ribohydrolase
MIAELRRAAERVDIVLCGPMTNLAIVLRLAPDVAENIGQAS